MLSTDEFLRSSQGLKIDGLVNVSQSYAASALSGTILAAKTEEPTIIQNGHTVYYPYRGIAKPPANVFAKRDLLVNLDETRALPFRLRDVRKRSDASSTTKGQKRRVEEREIEGVHDQVKLEEEEAIGGKKKRARQG